MGIGARAATLASIVSMGALPTLLGAQAYPTTPPAAAPVKPAALPPFQEAVLTNGVRIVLIENHKNPVVAFRLAIPAGDMYDPQGKSGTAELVASLLTKGAGTRSAEAIANAIESAGGSLSAGTDEDFMSIAGGVLSESAPLAFALLGDVVVRPTFAEKEFDLARTQRLSSLQLQASDPSAIASRYFAAGVYGKHPYGRRADATSVRAISRADLLAFQSARLKPRGALLVVAGDITLAKVRALAEQSFRGWTGAAAAAAVATAPPTRTATEILLVHRPGSVQSNLLVGNLALGAADPTRFAATLANRITGGGTDARLFTVLREQKSWTYGAYSRISRPRGIGTFEANAEVRTEVTDSALVELLAQLKKVGAEPIGASEFEKAKNAIVGSFPLTIETPQQLADRVSTQKLYGLPADYLQTYRTRMSAVTVAQVQAAAKAVIRPSQALVVVVGDGAKIYEKLKGIAPTRIVSVDGDAMTPGDLTPKASALALDFSKLTARRDSFVVMVQGNPLGTSVYSLEQISDGWAIGESTNIMNGMLAQTTTLKTDGSLNPRSLVQTGSMQGQQLKTDITFAGGRAKGTSMTAAQTGPKTTTVDTELPAGTLDSDAVQLALSLFRWAADAKFTVNAFSPGKGTVEPITLTVVGSESVKVPAGTFDTWKIEQKGGEGTVIFYVSKDAARRLVKIAPVGQPIELVLAK